MKMVMGKTDKKQMIKMILMIQNSKKMIIQRAQKLNNN